MIDVYTANTPNGVKVPVALEELQMPYRVHRIDLGANEQKRPEFLRLNPNGRIPVIVDPDGPCGAPLSVFESGAILWYLAETFPGLMPSNAVERIRALEYTFFQVGGARGALFRRATRRLSGGAGLGRPHRRQAFGGPGAAGPGQASLLTTGWRLASTAWSQPRRLRPWQKRRATRRRTCGWSKPCCGSTLH